MNYCAVCGGECNDFLMVYVGNQDVVCSQQCKMSYQGGLRKTARFKVKAITVDLKQERPCWLKALVLIAVLLAIGAGLTGLYYFFNFFFLDPLFRITTYGFEGRLYDVLSLLIFGGFAGCVVWLLTKIK